MISLSMGREVLWQKALALFGATPSSAVLPYNSPCPFCRGTLRVYRDHNAGGQWFSCTCGRTGNLLMLAEEVWGLDTWQAVGRLRAEGALDTSRVLTEADIPRYVQMHTSKYKRFPKFLEQAKRRLTVDDSTTLRTLQQKLGMRRSLDHDRWLAGPGRFCGGASRVEIEQCFTPGLTEASMEYTYKPSVPGSGWTDIVVIPTWDLPGRVKGFLMYGREGRIPEDTAFKAVRWSFGTDNDAGLFMMPAAVRRPEFEDTILVLSDPFMALRLHCWYAQDNSDTMPLVAVWNEHPFNTSPAVWDNLPQGRFVFWGPPAAKPALYRHARAASGLMSTALWPVGGNANAISRHPPEEWVRSAFAAEPWEEALEKDLASMSTEQAEALLTTVGLKGEDLEAFLSGCAPETRDRYRTVRQGRRTVDGGKNGLLETEEGWFDSKTRRLISDAVIRIEKAAYHPTLGAIYYGGHVHFRGRDLPFYERATVIEDDQLLWLRGLTIKAGAGYPRVKSAYADQLVEIATLFNPPETCVGTSSVGWDEANARFVFPRFVIKVGGEVEEDTAVVWEGAALVPGSRSPRPGAFGAEDARLLSEDEPHVRLFWAAAVSVLSNLMAPCVNQEPSGIAATGPGADAAAGAARLIGCVVCKPEDNYDHRWPYIPATRRGAEHLAWLQAHDPVNAFTSVNWHAAQALRCREGWHVLRADDYVMSVRPLATPGLKVIPEFLAYLARKRFALPSGACVFDAVGEAVCEWFGSLGPTRALEAGLAFVDRDIPGRADGRRLNAFQTLLCRAFVGGEFSVERTGFELRAKIKGKKLTAMPTEKGVFVPKTIVNGVLERHGAPLIDVPDVTRAMQAGGVLLRECKHNNTHGWLIKEEAWGRWLAEYERCDDT